MQRGLKEGAKSHKIGEEAFPTVEIPMVGRGRHGVGTATGAQSWLTRELAEFCEGDSE